MEITNGTVVEFGDDACPEHGSLDGGSGGGTMRKLTYVDGLLVRRYKGWEIIRHGKRGAWKYIAMRTSDDFLSPIQRGRLGDIKADIDDGTATLTPREFVAGCVPKSHRTKAFQTKG